MTLLALSGSLRAGSLNTALVRHAAGVYGGPFDMGGLDLPLYNGDVEDAGIPAAVQHLSDQISAADAVIISTPEYNKGLSGVLKNALDWVSRTPGKPWAGKPVAIMSATAGRSGGERAQNALRLCLQPFNPRLLNGPEVLVGSAHTAFENGTLTNERYAKAVEALMTALKSEVDR
ncbi:MAG: NAD(P)H-dependent oxidoreductase [Pseudomonadota bacterium]